MSETTDRVMRKIAAMEADGWDMLDFKEALAERNRRIRELEVQLERVNGETACCNCHVGLEKRIMELTAERDEWKRVAAEQAKLHDEDVDELTGKEERRRQEVIDLTIKMHELEAERDRLREAVEEIVQFHDGYCEQHINVSQHSHDLANIAQAAKEAQG